MPKRFSPCQLPWERAVALALLGASLASGAAAQIKISPQRYFQCQIAARQATNMGLEERAELLARAAKPAEVFAAGERSRLRVEAAFMGCGYSAEQLGAYAYERADVLNAWLAQNPATKIRLDALQAKLMQLSSRISALRTAQVPR